MLILALLPTIKDMDLASCFIIIKGCIRGSGRQILSMARVFSGLPMAPLIRAIMLMANQKGWALINGLTINTIKANGSTDSNMALVCGEDKKEILTLDNGNLEKLMDMVFILGLMGIDIKASSNNA